MPQLKKRPLQKVQVIRHDNTPVAVVLDIDDYYDLLEQLSPSIQKELKEAQRDIDLGRTIPQEELFKELGL
ncbi:hypothetical protein HY375_03780 [Candidatus Berkelbacteria bacterium]|nr:hypothetical protein [Candidatus Berkelbacteria bacterium]